MRSMTFLIDCHFEEAERAEESDDQHTGNELVRPYGLQ